MFLHITIKMFSNGRNEWNMEFLLKFLTKSMLLIFLNFSLISRNFSYRSTSPRSGDSPNGIVKNTKEWEKVVSFLNIFFFKIFREINGVFLLIFRKIGPRWRQCEIHARPWTFVCLVQDSSWIGWFVRKNFVKSQSFLWNSLTLWRE